MIPMHKGVINCIRFLLDETNDQKVLLTGGSDLFVNIINPANMSILSKVKVDAIPKSLDY